MRRDFVQHSGCPSHAQPTDWYSKVYFAIVRFFICASDFWHLSLVFVVFYVWAGGKYDEAGDCHGHEKNEEEESVNDQRHLFPL